MAFGTPFAKKPRTPEHVRPLTGSLVRIVLLGVLAAVGAAWGIYLYYTHSLRPKPLPQAVDSGEVEIQLQ